jgi:hypothetical protein
MIISLSITQGFLFPRLSNERDISFDRKTNMDLIKDKPQRPVQVHKEIAPAVVPDTSRNHRNRPRTRKDCTPVPSIVPELVPTPTAQEPTQHPIGTIGTTLRNNTLNAHERTPI